MQMPWFKIFYEARTDPKLLSLTRDEHFVWFNLLCYAAEQPVRGVIESFSDVVLARAVADGDVNLLLSALETMERFKIISCNTDATDCNVASVAKTVASRCITMLNFAKRQGENVACNTVTSTDRSRKSRAKKKLRGNATDATRCNDSATPVQRVATTDRDREEEKENTPQPPKGGEVWVSKNGSDPEPISKALPSEPAKPPFDDAELARVARKADELFPMMEFGSKVRGLACSFPLDCIDAALTEMQSGEIQNWKYLIGITKRIAADGGPKPSAQSRPRIHNPNPPPPGGSYHRSPATLARLAEQARARSTMESAAS